ncbi:MAG: TIR domain-containing protein, partial [Vulcanimicrobiota bacterium]
MGQNNEHYDEVFISYSRSDNKKVSVFVENLRRAGVTAWIDVGGIDGALLWGQEIVEAIDNSKVLILMASRSSLSSHNVVKEVALASEAQKHILPIHLETVETPKTLRYQLAGIQHIEFFTGDEKENFRAILRSLARLGVTIKEDIDSFVPVLSETSMVTDKKITPPEKKPEPMVTVKKMEVPKKESQVTPASEGLLKENKPELEPIQEKRKETDTAPTPLSSARAPVPQIKKLEARPELAKKAMGPEKKPVSAEKPEVPAKPPSGETAETPKELTHKKFYRKWDVKTGE